MLSKYLVLAVAVMASAVSAQKCQAQAVLERCLSDRDDIIAQCDQRADQAVWYNCLCKGYKAKKECFINCPNDPQAGTVENQVVSYCISAGGENDPNAPSAPVSSVDTPTPTGGADTPTTDDGADGDDDETPSGTDDAPEESGSAAPEENDEGAAGSVVARVGAVLGAGAAVAAWVL